MIKLIINGMPIQKNRHKCGCRGNKAFAYDPQGNEKQVVQYQIKSEIAKNGISFGKDENFEVKYTFVFPFNKSDTESQKKLKIYGITTHNIKPDLDNLEKFYSDCMTGLVWDDDAQVISQYSKKIFGKNPRTEIEIMVKEDFSENVKKLFSIFEEGEFNEFTDELRHIRIGISRAEDMEFLEGTTKKEAVELYAADIINFAEKYADKLKKINKAKNTKNNTE